MTQYVTDPSIGYSQVMGLTASQNIKTGPGMVCRVIVNTAPTAVAGIYDAASIGACGPSNLILQIPTTSANLIYELKWAVTNGITLVTTGGAYAICFS